MTKQRTDSPPPATPEILQRWSQTSEENKLTRIIIGREDLQDSAACRESQRLGVVPKLRVQQEPLTQEDATALPHPCCEV